MAGLVSDSVTISTNTHLIRTLTWAVPTSWADAANGPLTRVNICGIVTYYLISITFYVILLAFSFVHKYSSITFYVILFLAFSFVHKYSFF
jgi:hypothetical protein